MYIDAEFDATRNGVPARVRRYAARALCAGAVVGGAVLYERRLLATLDATPDDDDGKSFPAERIHDVVTENGGIIHVAECGVGRPVVLLHGHGSSLEIFARLAARLTAGGVRVIAMDHRGFGGSSGMPASFGFSGLVDDLAAVLEDLDLRGVTIVGHSMGGAVALGLAADRPEVVSDRVSGLVLLNSAARSPADGRMGRAKATVLDWRLIDHLGRRPRLGVLLTRTNFGHVARHGHIVAARAAGAASPVSRRRGFTRRLLGIDLSERLAQVRLPVLALAGAADRVLAPAESERIVARIDGARLEVLPGAGHVLPLERCGPVAELILSFVDDLDRADDGLDPRPPDRQV